MSHWGVDSVSPPDSRVGGRTLFDHVVAECGRVPEFWGRYIGFSANQIRPNELQFVDRKAREAGGSGCRIAIVYNGVRARSIPGQRGEHAYDSGWEHGERAVGIAKDLNIPHNVRIYCDLEGWRANPDWIRGWWDALYASAYVGMGGLYGRGAEYTLAQASDPLQLVGVASADLQQRRYPVGSWSEASTRAAVQQQSGISAGTLAGMAIGTGNRTALGNTSRHTWTNIPRGPRNPNETQFRGIGPIGSVTTVWQYCMDYLRTGGAGSGRIDMDLATEVGFREMWALTGA